MTPGIITINSTRSIPGKLERDKIVARIDMKAHREKDILIVRKLWPERGVRWSNARTRRLEAELQRVIRLAGVSRFEFEPNWLADAL